MKKLTILVDMDDTIENLLDAWLNMLNERYGTYVTLSDVKDWDLSLAYPKLTAEKVYGVLLEDTLWENVRPKWDAVEELKAIMDDGHDVYIVTSSNLKTISTKVECILSRYFPYIKQDHVIVCGKKQMLLGDVLVDDAPHNLEGGRYAKILMSAPHNLSYPAEEHRMARANNWHDVHRLINMYAENEYYQ